MRLLLAECDSERGSSMHQALSRAGYATDWVRSATHMQGALFTQHYDCAVLALPMPDVARDALLPALRRQRGAMPVLLVTGSTAFEDRDALLDDGADDFLMRPFRFEELIARIRSLMRRAQPEPAVPNLLVHGPIQLDPRRSLARWEDREIKLTQSEFAVIETLFRKRNQVVSRAQLEESLYGWGEEVHSNAVEVYVHFLRRKLYPGLIVTVRGLGYQLATEPFSSKVPGVTAAALRPPSG
jgi:DNA-binding response OmpR family regulator